MQIETITLRELRMGLKAPFETSSEITWNRRILLVEVGADGLCGWGEITTSEDPFYNAETTDTAWHIARDFIVPSVLGKTIQTAGEISDLLQSIRGHEMAKAGVENALWDIQAQRDCLPLAKLLGGTRSEIDCGVSIGIQPSTSMLLDKIERELIAGYQRIKLKIKPGKDLHLIEEVRKRYPETRLMVDANSAYRVEHTEVLKAFDQYALLMLEQPLAWDDIYQHSLLQKQLQTPICLDESIHNSSQAEAAIKLDACRIINIKLGRVGGHSQARRVHDVCVQHSIPVWCGGMLESGVGRAHNIAMSSLRGFSLPGDVSASQRYWEEDIIDPEVEVTPKGTIRVPTTPGLGFCVRRDRVESLTVRREQWRSAPTGSVMAHSPAKTPHGEFREDEPEPEIQIRNVEALSELEQVEALEREVWGIGQQETIPVSFLIPACEVGSILIGAFDGQQLVGFVFGFLGLENGSTTIHSHAMGIKAGYRDRGVGYRLKLAQREQALAVGIRQITWTFDPLQTRNAYLNFTKLGAICDSYKPNFYGERSSSFLHQSGTDRLWVRWLLESELVCQKLNGDVGSQNVSWTGLYVLQVSGDGEPAACSDSGALPNQLKAMIEIPISGENLPSLQQSLAWRAATRRAFTEALKAGFVVTDFQRSLRGSQEIGTYFLIRS